MVLDAVLAMEDVVLFNSCMPARSAAPLRQVGFRAVLLEVSEAELRRRHEARSDEEGWTKWFD